MSSSISTIVVRPSISNTDTITELKLTTPASDYYMVENPILYGGSTLFTLTSIQDLSSFFEFIGTDSKINDIEAEIYVLNSCFVIWLGQYKKGVQIDYKALILHAITKIDDQDCIYLQVESQNNSNELENTFEFFMKLNGIGEESNELFKEMQKSNIIADTYKALSICTSFHLDASSSGDEFGNDHGTEEQQLPTFPVIESMPEFILMKIDQDNVADDLNNEDIYDEDIHGSMIVDIGNGPVVGVARARDEQDEIDNHKSRRLN